MNSMLNYLLIAFALPHQQIGLLLLFNIILLTEANLNQFQENIHKITSQNNFVILNGEEAQRFRLLGILPSLHTFDKQIILGCITLTILIVSIFWFYLNGRRSNEDILSRLPEPVARLAFYVQFELVAFCSILFQDIMTIIHAPVGIGLNLASKLSGKGSFASDYASDESYSEDILAKRRSHSQGGRRRRQINPVNNQAGTSKRNEEGQHYAGIWNTGNSCFLNSTLQSIASVEEIRRYLEKVIEEAERWDVPTPVTDALYDIIIQLNTASNSRHAILPRQLTDALSNLPQTKVGSFFYAHQQQDAHELLVLVTSALDDEMNAVMAEKRESLRTYDLGLRAALVPQQRPNELITSLSFNPFRALIAQRTACLDCGYVEAVRHYPADEISLNVPARPGSAITIESCLAHWSKLEVVDWICFRCSLIRSINNLKDEASYLEHLAGQKGSPTEPSSPNGHHQVSNSSKKKSGAKRRKAKEFRQKTEILKDILIKGYSEDEVEFRQILQLNDIKLDRTFSRASTKQVMLARTPKVLVLHLNRSSYSASNFGASKNNAAVLFDDQLDLSNFVTGGDLNVNGDVPISRGATPSIGETASSNGDMWSLKGKKGKSHAMNGETELHPLERDEDGYFIPSNGSHEQFSFRKTRYRLCAIVVHYGNHSSGHYVSFRRRRANILNGSTKHGVPSIYDNHEDDFGSISNRDCWYRISDDSVRMCSLEDVRNQNPSLMFYERLGDDADRLATSKTIDQSLPFVNGHHSNGDHHHHHHQNGLVTHSHSNGNGLLSRSQSDCNVPQGFEAIAQRQENASHGVPIRPRVFHRWESMPVGTTITTIKKEEIESE